MRNLKGCPCGAYPEKLCINGPHDTPKWAYVSGDCCDEWMIEFRNDYHDIGSIDSLDLAVQAWNGAPRGGEHDETGI